LNNIVSTFLDTARIDQGQLTLKMEELDLKKIAFQVIEEQAVLAKEHMLSCVTDEPPRSYLVMGDSARLHQVLANLVENAVKYSPLGGPVTIGLCLCPATRAVKVSVSDRGMGIPPEAQPLLFERFYRVPQVVESQARGVGLGLYIVAHLIKMHGSQIHVESSGISGEGSRFSFELPALEHAAD